MWHRHGSFESFFGKLNRFSCSLSEVIVMRARAREFWRDDAGLILSAELVVILTVAVLGMINVQQGILGEFADLSLAFQSLNQSYSTPSYRGCWKNWGRTSWTSGSTYIDRFNGCVGSGPVMSYGGEILGGGSDYLPSPSNPVPCGSCVTTDPLPAPDGVGPAEDHWLPAPAP